MCVCVCIYIYIYIYIPLRLVSRDGFCSGGLLFFFLHLEEKNFWALFGTVGSKGIYIYIYIYIYI